MTEIRHLSPTFVLPAQRLPQEPQAGIGPMPWTPKTCARGGPSHAIASAPWSRSSKPAQCSASSAAVQSPRTVKESMQ